jgi:hypothetical protein
MVRPAHVHESFLLIEACANEKKNGNDKNNADPVHDCPVCTREVRAKMDDSATTDSELRVELVILTFRYQPPALHHIFRNVSE